MLENSSQIHLIWLFNQYYFHIKLSQIIKFPYQYKITIILNTALFSLVCIVAVILNQSYSTQTVINVKPTSACKCTLQHEANTKKISISEMSAKQQTQHSEIGSTLALNFLDSMKSFKTVTTVISELLTELHYSQIYLFISPKPVTAA